jgi:hypothetical protein
MLKKKLWASFQRIPKTLSLSSQKYGFGIRDPRSGIRDPRSGIWDPEKPISDFGSGSRGQKGTGSRIRLRNIGCDPLPISK